MLYLLLLLLGIGVLDCQADCNVCASPSGAACVSDTQFRFCQNNVLVDPVNSCPSGTYCTGDSAICQANSALKACTGCGQCNELRNFACLGVRTFALCLGTNVPSEITGSCAPNYVCNRENINICGTAASGFQATCPLVDDESQTTPSPNLNVTANVFCQTIQRYGRFPKGSDLATTCKQYFYCFPANNEWHGALYTCPGSTYFQASTAICNTTIPAYCTTSVTTLKVKNLVLF